MADWDSARGEHVADDIAGRGLILAQRRSRNGGFGGSRGGRDLRTSARRSVVSSSLSFST